MNKRVRKKKRLLRFFTSAMVELQKFDMKPNSMLLLSTDLDKVAPDEFYEWFQAFSQAVEKAYSDVAVMATSDKIKVQQQNTAIAEWVNEEENVWRCSNCGAVLEEDYNWRYHQFCYHCGCLMKHNYK